MVHYPGPTTLVGSTAYSEKPRDRSIQQEPAPPQRWPRKRSAQTVPRCGFLAQSSQRQSAGTIPRYPPATPLNSFTHSLYPSLYAFTPSGPGKLDQISIACARGPRFRASKVSATPPRVSGCHQLPTWRRRNLTVLGIAVSSCHRFRRGNKMNHQRRRFLHMAACAAALPVFSRVARAQAYPTRPVRIIAGFPPGGRG
jgi:hypothetical protein